MTHAARAFSGIYRDRTVLVTGHTGFKGTWLRLWLEALGARVVGYALPPATRPSHHRALPPMAAERSVHADVRDLESLTRVVEIHEPSVIFHLAARSQVQHGRTDPAGTVAVNLQGTVNVLEAARRSPGVRAVVVVSTDKCYCPPEPPEPLSETDPLGAPDPYGASKAMAELAVTAWRQTFGPKGLAPVATGRAGNALGGGDFAPHRLLPDCFRAFSASQPVRLRQPRAIRPWQHVLDPLSGYLWLGARLVRRGEAFAGAWNFGPADPTGVPTATVAREAARRWGPGATVITAAGGERSPDTDPREESIHLLLDPRHTRRQLGWWTTWSWKEAVAETVAWYARWGAQPDPEEVLAEDLACIRRFTACARDRALPWAHP